MLELGLIISEAPGDEPILVLYVIDSEGVSVSYEAFHLRISLFQVFIYVRPSGTPGAEFVLLVLFLKRFVDGIFPSIPPVRRKSRSPSLS